MKASLLVDETLAVKPGKYQTIVKVYEVEKSKKFPQGIKAKFLLQDVENNSPRLLVDNHEPYGFHMHTKLPGDHDHRVELNVDTYQEAMTIFFDEIERILKNEETPGS